MSYTEQSEVTPNLLKKLEELEARNKEMLYLIKFIYNPYSAPEETLRRISETHEQAKKLLGGR